jgi:ethanolamine permease
VSEAAIAPAPPAPESGKLRRTLGPLMLWGLGVGYVISGEYFGWNLGLPAGGTYGMLAATLMVTVMYAAFVLSYAELACAIPKAGGAFVYALRALGPGWGFIAGLCQWIEFVFAPPAIALAIGAYLGTWFPGIPEIALAAAAYVLLTGLNMWGVKQAATFELFVTVIAVVELLIFCGVTAPHFEWTNITNPVDALPNGWAGAFAAIPFAIWFYLAIEGVANAAEEARNPQRDVAIGFSAAMATLVVLALGVFFCAVGVGGWREIVYVTTDGVTTTSDKPLPLAMAHAVSRESWLYSMLIGIGLFGLLASFHGILLAGGRATMALGQAGYAPRLLGKVHERTGTPIQALLANLVVGIAALLTGQTGAIITISVFGAVGLYVISMIALFVLRKKEPDLPRPFRAILYPLFPATALVLAAVCLVALVWFNLVLAGAFAGLLALGFLYFVVVVRPRLARETQ